MLRKAGGREVGREAKVGKRGGRGRVGSREGWREEADNNKRTPPHGHTYSPPRLGAVQFGTRSIGPPLLLAVAPSLPLSLSLACPAPKGEGVVIMLKRFDGWMSGWADR